MNDALWLGSPVLYVSSKAKNYDPTKRQLHVWVRVGWMIDQITAGGGTTVTFL